jgi:hypothetical protein
MKLSRMNLDSTVLITTVDTLRDKLTTIKFRVDFPYNLLLILTFNDALRSYKL